MAAAVCVGESAVAIESVRSETTCKSVEKVKMLGSRGAKDSIICRENLKTFDTGEQNGQAL